MEHNDRPPKTKRSYLRYFVTLGFSGFCITLVFLCSAVLYLNPQLPSVEELRSVKLQTPLRVYSKDEKLIGEYGEKKRIPLKYEDVPESFTKALLAAEDDRFYSHYGVDLRGLLRAAFQLMTTGQIRSGGSTITMQVARNFFLTRDQTFSRKFNEILLALQIEQELSKQEILELYINKIYLGKRAYGIEAAAQIYYGVSINELNLAQLAMLAGLPKAPSRYNPINDPERSLQRRNWILGRMKGLGYINENDYQQAIDQGISALFYGPQPEVKAPYVAEMARQKLVSEFGEAAYTEGYTVYTTISSKLQEAANRAVIDNLIDYDRRHGYRGVEKTLRVDSDSTKPNLQWPIDQWQAELQSLPIIADLVPAVVVEVNEQSIKVLLADGFATQDSSNAVIDFADMAWAKPFIDVNTTGSAPKSPGDVVAVGDVIRIRREQSETVSLGKWVLSQVPEVEAAFVAINPEDGSIKALVGGLDFNKSKFNRAVQGGRQPGSNFKPFIYSAALENGFTAASIINDAPLIFNDEEMATAWRPKNSEERFFGPTRLRQALFRSRNIVSIKLLRELTPKTAINYVRQFGFSEEKLPSNLQLALGGGIMKFSPLDVAIGYAAFANGGYKVNPYLIDKVVSLEQTVVYQSQPEKVCPHCTDAIDKNSDNAEKTLNDQLEQELALLQQSSDNQEITAVPTALSQDAQNDTELTNHTNAYHAKRIMEPRTAYIMNSMLRDVIRQGTGRGAQVLNRSDIGGKTATTDDAANAWFSGFNSDIVASTWVGFDQTQSLGDREYGATAALPIWIDFMKVALKDKPEKLLARPDGLVDIKIDPENGNRARPEQRNALFEIFRVENAPSELPQTSVVQDSSNKATKEPEAIF